MKVCRFSGLRVRSVWVICRRGIMWSFSFSDCFPGSGSGEEEEEEEER